jgi:hypothetical protein
MGQDVGDRVKERNRPSKQKSNGGMKWAEALHHGDGHRGSDEDWLRLVVPDASCLRRCRRRVLRSCIEPTRPRQPVCILLAGSLGCEHRLRTRRAAVRRLLLQRRVADQSA